MHRSIAHAIVIAVTLALLPNADAAGVAADSKPREIKIKGYVTNVTSPTQFEIEDYRITRDRAFVLEFENESPELRFRPEDIKVGVELEINGYLDEATHTLRPTSIKVDLDQFKKGKHTAVITYQPVRVTRDGDNWTGTFVADGQRIQLTPTTKVLFKLTSREKKLAKEAAKTEDDEDDEAFEPLKSLDQITAGMLMSYEGPRTPDGTILAERIEFSRNDLEKGEAKMWDSIVPEVKAFAGTKPPGLKISNVGKYKLIADEEVQTYVTKLGQSLIPEHQRALAQDDPRRLNFRFYVIDDAQPNAFALPNGILVVNAGMFALLENEAQLAAVVGHEIAHATQEHTWRQRQFHKKKRVGLMIAAAVAQAYGKYNLADMFTLTQAAIQNGYSRSLENQADRVGMEYMVAAGYDPRQAPQVWKAMTKVTGNHATNFFWSSHDNHATRRSYLMNELRMNHADLDYSTVRVTSSAFADIQQRVVNASREKITLRASPSPAPTALAVGSPTTAAVRPVPSMPPPSEDTKAVSPLPASEQSQANVDSAVEVAAPQPEAMSVPRTIVVAGGAPIFLVPDANRSPLSVVPQDQSLEFLARDGEWYQVAFKDQQWGRRVGYVHQAHVKHAGSS